MFVVSLSDEEKNIYGLYNRLRQCFVNANINVLRQICIYICRSSFDGDIYKDIIIKYDDKNNTSLIILNNGIEIEFDDLSNEFYFIVSKKDGKSKMKSIVNLVNQNNPCSIYIYSELNVSGYGMYVVAFRPKDICNDNTLKYASINYYTEDEIEWVREIVGEDINTDFDLVAKSNFIFPFSEGLIKDIDLLPRNDNSLDCYQGYISEVLTRIDLLYNNMKYVKVKRKKLDKK